MSSFQEIKSSRDIDKQVKRAEVQQKYLYRTDISYPTTKKSIWELVKKLASFFRS